MAMRCSTCSKRLSAGVSRCAHCDTDVWQAHDEVAATSRLIGETYPLRRLATAAMLMIGAVVVIAGVLFTDGSTAWVSLVAMLLGLTSAALVMVWLWRARTNLIAFPEADGSLGAGWAIAGWLVPVANLFVPALLMVQIARNSIPQRGVHKMVAVWWAAYLATPWVWAFAGPDATKKSVSTTIVLAIAGGILCYLINEVTQAQDAQIQQTLRRD